MILHMDRMPASSLPASALLLPLVLAAAPADAQAPVIRSGLEPDQGTRRVALVERWRAGANDDDVFFGVIDDVARDDLGRVYLLDRQLCRVFVYSPDGEYLRALSGEGEGPGEVRAPRALVLLPDGGVGILHRVRGRITCLDADGTPAADIVLCDSTGEARHGLNPMEAERRGPALAVQGFTIVYGEGGRTETRLLSVYDLSGRERYPVFAAVQRAFDFERRTFTERLSYTPVWALGPDGSLYVAPDRNRYRIEQRGPDGALVRVIEREYEALLRSTEEKESVAAGATMTINGQQVPLEAEIEDRAPCIGDLEVDGAGGLWVGLSRSRSKDAPVRVLSYDHFGPDGRYLERVEVVNPADPDHDQLIMLDPERFVVLRRISDAWAAMFAAGGAEAEEEGSLEPLEVVYYEAAP